MLTHSVDFKSKKIRINLNMPIKAEQKAESTDVLKTVDEDRKYVIQATIVRYVVYLAESCFIVVDNFGQQYHEGT